MLAGRKRESRIVLFMFKFEAFCLETDWGYLTMQFFVINYSKLIAISFFVKVMIVATKFSRK